MMSPAADYDPVGPSREEVDRLSGPTVLEFGTPWCGYCRAAQPIIAAALGGRSEVRHLKVEDGSGKRLGRSFGVNLWPTLVFLKDGKELARRVRPRSEDEIRSGLDAIS
jgi:thioredoxin 1